MMLEAVEKDDVDTMRTMLANIDFDWTGGIDSVSYDCYHIIQYGDMPFVA